MPIQKKDKLPSPPEVSNKSKVEGVNIISSNFHDDSQILTFAISLRSGKLLDQPNLTSIEKQVKSSDYSIKPDSDTTDSSLPTYKPIVSYV